MFQLDKKMGFASITLMGVAVYLVWGWRGNCYGTPRVIRFDLNRGVWWVITTLEWGRKDTTLYWRGLSFNWNSEHIARKWGICHNEDGLSPCAPIGWYSYRGVLGNHDYV